jgi:hypothetical protein
MLLMKAPPVLQMSPVSQFLVTASWTGEMIADFVQKVIVVTNRPAAYLKDGRQCLKLVETIPPHSPVPIGFTNWMKKRINEIQYYR